MFSALGLPVQGLTEVSLLAQAVAHAVFVYGPASEEEVSAVLSRFEEIPPNMLHSGAMHGRSCLLLVASSEVSCDMRRSFKALQETVLVLWKMDGMTAYNGTPEFKDLDILAEINVRQFLVYVVSAHDLVFPFSAEPDEIHTLSKKARNDILKHRTEWLA
eukprot:3583387-Amphidinium_carterae.1